MDDWAVARKPNLVEVFRVSISGILRAAAFSDEAGKWKGWSPVSNTVFPPNQPVCALASAPDVLHAFVVDNKGGVQSFLRKDGGQWQGPIALPGITVPANPISPSAVTGVSRAPGTLDLFAARNPDGVIVTAAWKAGAGPPGTWGAWSPVADAKSPADFGGAADVLSAVARDPGRLDVFAYDGHTIRHAAWDAAKNQWQPWHAVGEEGYAGGRPSAVARTPTSLDVFTLTPYMHAAWDHAVLSGQWRGWFFSGQEADAQPTKAVARNAKTIELFGFGQAVTKGPTGVLHASRLFDAKVEDEEGAKWSGWEIIPGDLPSYDSRICALSRMPHLIEVFVNGKDTMFVAKWDGKARGKKWTPWSEIAPASPSSPPSKLKQFDKAVKTSPFLVRRLRQAIKIGPVVKKAAKAQKPPKKPHPDPATPFRPRAKISDELRRFAHTPLGRRLAGRRPG